MEVARFVAMFHAVASPLTFRGQTVQDLIISSVDNSTVVAVNDDGVEFRIPIDEATLARLKRTAAANEVRVSPRDIQAQLRLGLSTAEVAALTGATVEHVERYAGPIVAERDYVVSTAQATPAFEHIDTAEDSTSFGDLIASRLELVDARNVMWTAWKNEDGVWVVKLTFSVADIERDARWEFDLKRSHIAPASDEAQRLSASGTFEPVGVPALRAVDRPALVEVLTEIAPVEDATLTASDLPPLDEIDMTAPAAEDVLDALRRRRRESEDAPAWLRDDVSARTAPVAEIFEDSLDIPLDNFETDGLDDDLHVFPTSDTGGHKRKRPAMPSWNDIVSDTRADDELI